MTILTPTEADERDLRLRATGIFDQITAETLAHLESLGLYVSFSNEVIVKESQALRFFHFVVQGHLEVTRAADNGNAREGKLLATIFAGQCFGEMSFLLHSPASAHVWAGESVVTWTIPHEVLRDFTITHPGGGQLVSNIAALLAQRLIQANLRINR